MIAREASPHAAGTTGRLVPDAGHHRSPKVTGVHSPVSSERQYAGEPALGFEVLHNRTGRPFITSDNSVSWFDPRVPEVRRRPYYVNRADLRAELIFPIDSRTLLRGTNALRRHHGDRPTCRDITDEAVVRRLNRITAQFAYRLVFCEDRSFDRLVALYRDTSPVVRTDVQILDHGDLLGMEVVFGRRPVLPKWRRVRDADPFDGN